MPTTILHEEFRPVKSTRAYRVSNLGRVQSCWSRRQACFVLGNEWHDLKTWKHPMNYPVVGLQIDGKRISKTVHELVMEAFVGPRPDGMQVCHNDGDPTNNSLDNLRYDTPVENNADKKIHGTELIGSRAPRAKLNEKQVLDIVRLARMGVPQTKIPARLGITISSGAIAQIMVGNNWGHLTGIPKSAKKRNCQ